MKVETRPHDEPTSAEFILRVRVPISSADTVQRVLGPLASKLRGSLSRIERADFDNHSVHVNRRKIV